MGSYEGMSVCTPFDQPWNFRKKFHRPKYRRNSVRGTVMNNFITRYIDRICDFISNWELKIR